MFINHLITEQTSRNTNTHIIQFLHFVLHDFIYKNTNQSQKEELLGSKYRFEKIYQTGFLICSIINLKSTHFDIRLF